MSSNEYTAKGGTRFDRYQGIREPIVTISFGDEKNSVPLADLIEFVRHVEGQGQTLPLPDCELGEPVYHGPQPYRWCKKHQHFLIACEVRADEAKAALPLTRRTEVLAMMAATIYGDDNSLQAESQRIRAASAVSIASFILAAVEAEEGGK